MHRSGTSAFTGILNLLGVNLGAKMLETQSDNSKGFFENKYVVLANNCILESFNSSWDDPLPLPENWTARFEDSQLLEDARIFLRTDFPADQLSAIKDPRLCRLLPFWLPLLAAENITPRVALVIRNPLEIADSLSRRNQFSIEKSLVLWMQYLLDAERNTRHLPRCLVTFESVLSEPRGTMERVFKTVGLDAPNFSAVDPEALDKFLDHNMRHHDVPDNDLNVRCHKIIADYYRLLCKISEGETAAEDFEALDDLADRFQRNQTLFYNSDVVLTIERAKEENSPVWYQAKLNRVKAQFDADKTFREYRYIANTEHLYHDRITLHGKSQDLQNDNVALQGEISILQSEVTLLWNKLLTPHITISALRHEVASQSTEVDVLQRENDARVSKIATLQGEIASYQQSHQALENAIAAHKADELSRQQARSEQDRELAQQRARSAQLHSRNEELEKIVLQISAMLPWRVYRMYRQSIEAIFPEGTLLRRLLQRSKRLLRGTDVNTVLPTDGDEERPPTTVLATEQTGHLLDVSITEEVATEEGLYIAAANPQSKPDNIYNVEIKEPTTVAPEQESDARDLINLSSEESASTLPMALEPALKDSKEQARLSFPIAQDPNISIIIPVFNNWSFTYNCLRSLSLHNRGSCEIIIVDNNSTDETPKLLAAVEGIQVLTNETNEVFVNACNQAAAVAKGNFLIFLNNDTEVSEGWLDAMLAPFADDSTGIVGAKLVYPDGSLQEAGGIIWSDGNGCNYGHGDNPDLPQYSYRKSVDYCSGACLMIRHTLWREIGGFDQRFAPAYYEDTDLCFTVRSLNYKVIYQPAARIVHYGGASAGKDLSSGYKRYQDINRLTFIEKWQEVLERDHVLSSAGLYGARERAGDKHIFVIDHNLPMFDRDSGSLRMLRMLQILQDMGYKVSFWPDQLAYDPRYTRILQDLGIETYYGDLQFDDFIKAHGNALDVVLMSRPATTKKYLHLVKKYSTAKTIFDTVDLHYVREQRRLTLEVQRWRNLEFFLAEEADITLVVSPTEKDILKDQGFAHKIAVVSNIHSLEPCLKGFEERQGLMFIGSFAHLPNEEGIIWFIDYILPRIKKKIPGIHLTIVGSEPTVRLLGLANESVTVTGYVEDVSEYFNSNRVFVSPLLHGAGVKGKIGQSFSYGLPVVTTSIGAEGMQLTDKLNVLISDSETAFADNVIALYKEKYLWQKLSTNCRQVITEQFSTETIRAALEQILDTETPKRQVNLINARPVIVHCHLFKNAGSTLDWSLQRQFGDRFVGHRDDDNMRRGAPYLKPYLEAHQEISALSSHHIRFPLPVSEDFHLLPLISLRHPIDRARSVYDFERRQEANTPGAIQAKKLSFADYVRWRMQPDVAPTIRNFHCSVCTSNFDTVIGEQAYIDSVAMLLATPLLVIVERYDESMILLEHELEKYFPDIDLSYIRQNETFGREIELVQRIESVFEQLGPELTVEFREKNHWDMRLYENSLAILGERLGSLSTFENLMGDFHARCRLLSVATLPSNAVEIPGLMSDNVDEEES